MNNRKEVPSLFSKEQEEYISNITDIPSIITEVFENGKRHRVVDRLNAPKKLKNLYTELDLIVDKISTWKECH